MLCVALASPFIYLALPHGTYLWYFDLTQSVRDHERIRHGERFPVTRIDDIYDFQAFSPQSSSLHPYEPMFGYFLETFASSTRVGGIYQEQDGRLNMTNPASSSFRSSTACSRSIAFAPPIARSSNASRRGTSRIGRSRRCSDG